MPAPSGASPSPSGTASGSSASPSASASTSIAPSAAPTAASASPGGGPNLAAARVALAPVAAGLSSPVFVTGAGDGSGRLFVLEQPGTVRVIANGQLSPTPYVDLTSKIASGGERGLLGLAFAPGFGKGESRLYVHYSNTDGDTTVAELKASADTATVDPASERILLVEKQPYPNHNGGWIGFDAKGRLLIGLGDGGSGGDPENRASNLATILGKLLRIDVLAGPADGRPYAIPADNPFIATAGARPEILHFGLRNPYRDSVDPATGTIWIGDLGQGAWEEVDRAAGDAAGLDFGWRRWEGRHCYNPSSGCDPAGVTMPVAEYSHNEGCAIVGGVVYRGAAIPALQGAYLFGDYCSGTLWAIDAGGADQQEPVKLLATGLSLSSINAGDDGEVYLTDLRGTVQRLVAAGG
ncbi:MAG: PQQ-dependent sugar dehydrogenase [Chloroflexota bacterium]